MAATRPSLEYLVTSSQQSLESFELSRLNQASNLRKELRDVVEEWVQTEVDARFARWILECRRTETTPSDAVLPALLERAGFSQLELPFGPPSICETPQHISRDNRGVPEPAVARAWPNQLSALPASSPDTSASACLAPRESAAQAASQIHKNPPPALDIRNSLLALMPDDVRSLLQAAEQLAQQKATRLGSRRDLDEELNLSDASAEGLRTPRLLSSANFRLSTVQTRFHNRARPLRRIGMNSQQNAETNAQPSELHPPPHSHDSSTTENAYDFAIAPAC
jgi:hypothetical protein